MCNECKQEICFCRFCPECKEKGSDCRCGDLEDYYDAMRERAREEEMISRISQYDSKFDNYKGGQ